MSENTKSWKDLKEELGVTDDLISERRMRTVKKWEKLNTEREEYVLAIEGATSERNKFEQGTPGYKKKDKEIKLIADALADTESSLQELNEELCKIMQSIAKDPEKVQRAREHIKNVISKNTDGSGAGQTDPPKAITDEMLGQLFALQYTKEDVDAMTVADAQAIIQAQTAKAAPAPSSTETAGSDKGSTQAASIPVMITTEMRQYLSALGYTEADIDKMKPEQAVSILEQQIPNTNYTAAPPAPATKPPKVAKSTDGTEKKKGGIGKVILGAVLGLFVGGAVGIMINKK